MIYFLQGYKFHWNPLWYGHLALYVLFFHLMWTLGTVECVGNKCWRTKSGNTMEDKKGR